MIIDGVEYFFVAEPEQGDPCYGCAFENDPALCDEAEIRLDCLSEKIIWKEAKTKGDAEKALKQDAEREPSLEDLPPEKQAAFRESMQALRDKAKDDAPIGEWHPVTPGTLMDIAKRDAKLAEIRAARASQERPKMPARKIDVEDDLTASEHEHLEKYPHYYRDIRHLNVLDIYRVLDLFSTGDSALDHAAKKILAAGKRGAKDKEKDIKEAIDTLTRRLEMLQEDKRK
jgi:hypothetical protein